MILISKKDELGSNFVQWELFFEEPKPIFIRSLIVNEKSSVGTFFEEPKPIFIRSLIVNGIFMLPKI